MVYLRQAFVTGILLLLPLFATLFVINFLLESIGAPISRHLFFFINEANLGHPIIRLILSFVSLVVVCLVITAFGLLSRYFLGRYVMDLTEKIVSRIPLIKSVYLTTKQIIDTLKKNSNSAFQKAVLVEFPREGLYSIGFLTGTTQGEVQEKTAEEVVNVFVPTTPNPTSGFLILVPKNKVYELEMSVGDGIKMIISGGAVTPPYPNPNKNSHTLNVSESK